jgi:pectinesterase
MKQFLLFSILLHVTPFFAQHKIIVDCNGKSTYKTIQGAINSINDSSNNPTIIYIKKGVYKEKIYIEKGNIIFEGESSSNTIISMAIARDEWRCNHNDDWGVATVNVDANDITFKNLSIINSYGKDNEIKSIFCPLDTAAKSKYKMVSANSHQMALRTMKATRIKAINCNFSAYGGDTVSPWNVEDGMFYFKNCTIDGGVDFYCPRGWAWAEGCIFTARSGTAAIWHDGSKNEDAKAVLKNCTFKGYNGFLLGRYHKDAQFFLVNCTFASNMADSAIYKVPTTNTIKWGHRVYYYNCKKEDGKIFDWFKNNLPNNINNKNINVNWVFNNKWNPEN